MAQVQIYAWSAERPQADSDYSRVLELHRDHRSTLGHLPFAAFEEARSRGRLIVGSVDGTVQGYVLYSTPRQQTLKLVHVCVGKGARGTGLAKEMVHAAIAANPDRALITAHCRSDYDIDGFWYSLDMAPTGERPGRAADVRPRARIDSPSSETFEWTSRVSTELMRNYWGQIVE